MDPWTELSNRLSSHRSVNHTGFRHTRCFCFPMFVGTWCYHSCPNKISSVAFLRCLYPRQRIQTETIKYRKQLKYCLDIRVVITYYTIVIKSKCAQLRVWRFCKMAGVTDLEADCQTPAISLTTPLTFPPLSLYCDDS